jgi:hypothetical protein
MGIRRREGLLHVALVGDRLGTQKLNVRGELSHDTLDWTNR